MRHLNRNNLQDLSDAKIIEYVKDLEVLSDDEVKDLAHRSSRGDKEAIDKLVRHNLRLVVHIAREYTNQWVPFEDLVSAGIMGLLKAAPLYVYSKETKFISYSAVSIRRSIYLEISKTSRTIRLTKGAAERLVALKDRIKEGDSLEGDDALLYQVSTSMVSLDSPLKNDHDGGAGSPLDIVYEGSVSCEDTVLKREVSGIITSEIDRMLTEKEAIILKKYYGFLGNPPMTFDEIADEYKVTRSRIGKLVKDARIKLSRSRAIKDYIRI